MGRVSYNGVRALLGGAALIGLIAFGDLLIVGLAGLLGLQLLLGWALLSVTRRHGLRTTLVQKGKIVSCNLRALGLSTADVRAAIRSAGLLRMDEVEDVVREPDGSLGVTARARHYRQSGFLTPAFY
jgi:uncharacterized membrane protein YcaP (DUF421 family)